jgi:hypothetical protein
MKVIDEDTNDAEGTQTPSGPYQDVSTCQPMSPAGECTNLREYSIPSATSSSSLLRRY